MQRTTALLALALAIAAPPVALAQDLGAPGVASDAGASGALAFEAPAEAAPPEAITIPAVEDAVAPLPLEVEPLPAPATSLVDEAVGVSLSVQATAAGQDVGAGVSAGQGPARASPSEQAAALVVPVAATGAAAVSVGALAIGLDGLRALNLRLSEALRRILRGLGALAGAAPLFSRIEGASVLDNPVRARVHDAIAQEPGLSLSEVCQRAGIAWGTAVHHVRRLEAHGLVVSNRELAHRRFFAANTPAAAHRAAVAVVLHPTARRIAEYVAQRPGTDQQGLCRALGLNNPAASKHLGHFESRGLVLSQRSGRSRLYHPTSGLHAALGLLEPAARPEPVAAIAAPQRAVLLVGAA